MNSRLPSGETRTTDGFSPPGVGIVATCCAEGTSMTLTFWLNWFVTYAVLPSGEKVTPVGTCPVGVKPSTLRVLVLVMPTPPFWNSVKYARPSSRTAMPKDGGVATSPTNNPLGCVVGSSLGAAVAMRTPEVTGGDGACAVGDLLDAHAQNETAPQLSSRPAIVVRCMSASRIWGEEAASFRTASAHRMGGRPACNPHSRMCRPVNTFCGFGVASGGQDFARGCNASRVARERRPFQNDGGGSTRGREAPVGIEPTNRGFADLCLTTWLRRRLIAATRT